MINELNLIEILLLLIASHFVCDYVFQTGEIAVGKNRNLNLAHLGVNWWYWLTTHAIIHALGVALVTTYVLQDNLRDHAFLITNKRRNKR